jgi:hypothetical protein
MFAYTCNELNRIEAFVVSEIRIMNIKNPNQFVRLLQTCLLSDTLMIYRQNIVIF